MCKRALHATNVHPPGRVFEHRTQRSSDEIQNLNIQGDVCTTICGHTSIYFIDSDIDD